LNKGVETSNNAANGFEKLLGKIDQNRITRTSEGVMRKPNAIWNKISPLVQPAMLLLRRRSSFGKEAIAAKKVERVASSSRINWFFEWPALIGKTPISTLNCQQGRPDDLLRVEALLHDGEVTLAFS